MKRRMTGLCMALALLLTGCGEPEEEAVFQIGEMNGGTYSSAFLGIGCTLNESWTYHDEEEIAQLNNLVVESQTDEAIQEALESLAVFQDMVATAEDGLVSINVTFEKLGVYSDASLDEEQYAAAAMGVVESALGDMGLAGITAEKTTVLLANKERTAIVLTATLEEIPFYETLVLIKRGEYMATITLASYFEDVTGELTALFEPLKT